MADDLPYYETFYGIYVDDWEWNYGGYFTDHKYILTKEYLNEGCETSDYTQFDSTGNNTVRFFYPHWIKRKYYVEGTAIGQFTLSCTENDAEISDYTVSIYKLSDTGIVTPLGTTGIIYPLNVDFDYDFLIEVCTERVYPFEIEISPEKEMLSGDRLFIELIINVKTAPIWLYHSNDATWEDFKIQIPFRGL